MKENYATMSDLSLFIRLREPKPSSEWAFAELYTRYSQRIFSYCLRVTGDNNTARDIFQETFMSLLTASQKNNIPDNIAGYLFRIAHNLYVNYYKDIRREVISLEDLEISTNDELLENKEMLDLLAKSLESLDPEHKEAFILRLYQGLSYQEIADIMKTNTSTARNRVWRAKEKIKAILEPILTDINNNG